MVDSWHALFYGLLVTVNFRFALFGGPRALRQGAKGADAQRQQHAANWDFEAVRDIWQLSHPQEWLAKSWFDIMIGSIPFGIDDDWKWFSPMISTDQTRRWRKFQK